MQNKNLKIGVTLIMLAALGNSSGQLAWKLGTENSLAIVWYLVGFVLAGAGAFLLMISFRFGQVSILQPMMSVSYVYSIVFGYLFLGEPITLMKVLGTVCIIIGAIILGTADADTTQKKAEVK